MLHGEKGLFKYIEGVLQARGHAVICIAEGAGQARSPLGLYPRYFGAQPCCHLHCRGRRAGAPASAACGVDVPLAACAAACLCIASMK